MNLTENEIKVLNAICHNFYGDGPGDHIWSDSINDSHKPSGIEGKALSGVVSSLTQKGMVETGGDKKDATCWVTEAGMNYFKNVTDKDSKPYVINRNH